MGYIILTVTNLENNIIGSFSNKNNKSLYAYQKYYEKKNYIPTSPKIVGQEALFYNFTNPFNVPIMMVGFPNLLLNSLCCSKLFGIKHEGNLIEKENLLDL